MNTNCERYRDLIADFVNGTIQPDPSRQLDEHLRTCGDCRGYLQALQQEDRLLTHLIERMDEGMADRRQRLINVLHARPRQSQTNAKWRTLMNTRTVKIAAVALVAVAVLIGVGPFWSASITFADVVEPILTARTIRVDVLIGSDPSGPTMHETIAGTKIRRTISNMPNLTQVLDLDAGRMLALDDQAKTAIYVDIQGAVQQGTQNYVEFLRQIVRQVQEGQVERLEERTIDGRPAIGFVGKGVNEKVTIWADADTGHPLRIELTVGREFDVVMKNFQFSPAVDPSLFSMTPPDGYTLNDAPLDLSSATEADFIESLRIWAEIGNDGVFPDQIGTEHTMKQLPALVTRMIEQGLSEEQGTQAGMQIARGMIFHQRIESSGDWSYTGPGVKLGDADTPIFRYQPAGSDKVRIIYGDLTVKEVAPDNQP